MGVARRLKSDAQNRAAYKRMARMIMGWLTGTADLASAEGANLIADGAIEMLDSMAAAPAIDAQAKWRRIIKRRNSKAKGQRVAV